MKYIKEENMIVRKEDLGVLKEYEVAKRGAPWPTPDDADLTEADRAALIRMKERENETRIVLAPKATRPKSKGASKQRRLAR